MVQLTNRIKTLSFLGIRVTGIRREVIYVFVHQSQSFPLLGIGNRSRCICRRFHHIGRTSVRPTHKTYNLTLNSHKTLFFVSKIIKRKHISICVEFQEDFTCSVMKRLYIGNFTNNLFKYIFYVIYKWSGVSIIFFS